MTRVVIDEHAVGSAGEQGPEPLPGTASLQYRGGMKAVVTWFLEAGGRYDLAVLGAHPTRSPAILASDSLASSLIRKRSSDILIVLGAASRLSWPSHRRILVPVNGLAHAITASDLAAYLAQQYEAEIVLLHVVPPHSEQAPGERAAPKAGELDRGMARRLADRLSHIGIRASSRVHVGYDPGEAIVRHLGQERYGLVVLGGVDRGAAQP